MANKKMTKHIITAEDLVNNPELVEAGIVEGDEIEYPEKGEINEGKKVEVKEPGKAAKLDMASYEKAYPNEKKFFVSTDGQVFLSTNEADAKAHQASVNDKETVPVHNVK